ncbi:hypothetical protein [Thermovibrio sp.]
MVRVKVEKRSFPPLYDLKPSEVFELFKEKLENALQELPSSRLTNRALKELMRRKGKRVLKKLKNAFLKADSYPLQARKLIYNAFYRVFLRYQWADRAGSEREVELKVWITSSIDYLLEFSSLLEERYGRS